MSRFDYKQSPISTSNSLCTEMSISLAERVRGRLRSVDGKDSPSLVRSSGSSPSLEHLVLEQSSDDEEVKPGVCLGGREVCEIVNLPRDIVGRTRGDEGNLVIVDSERFLRLVVEKMNTSGFLCHCCGTLMDGKMMLAQLYGPLV